MSYRSSTYIIIALAITSVLYFGFREGHIGDDTPAGVRASREDTTFEGTIFPWLRLHELTTMKDEKAFRPHDTISRGEAARFFAKYAPIVGNEKTENKCSFKDIGTYDTSLVPSIIESCEYGLMRGASGKFDPYGKITEAEALTVIIRSMAGMYDETGEPWYREYFSAAEKIGLITTETLISVETVSISREKLAKWLYIAGHTDRKILEEDELIIYETEVDGPADCSSFEKYDKEKKICTFECTSKKECSNIEKQINEELEGWSEELESKDRDAPTGSEEEKNILVSYRVSTGEEIGKISGTDTSEYRALWKEVRDLSPDSLSDRYIEMFNVYSDPSSDILAFVVDDDGNGKWKIAINLAMHKKSDIKEQKATIIHELAHIITLNGDQFIKPSGACPNYETDEGCTKSDAYLSKFVKKYWGTAKTLPYEENTFVSEYASTNPEEDIAESFAFFVLGRNFSEANIRESKLNFFNSYEELVQIRESMRGVLASEILRAKRQKINP